MNSDLANSLNRGYPLNPNTPQETLVNAVEANDFTMVVDYNDILEGQPSSLHLRLFKQPSSVKKTIWEPEIVNYLIRK